MIILMYNSAAAARSLIFTKRVPGVSDVNYYYIIIYSLLSSGPWTFLKNFRPRQQRDSN